jgi:transcriptional regulator with XRE-family HTH domain
LFRFKQALLALLKTFYTHIFVKQLAYTAFLILITMTIGEHIMLLRKQKGLSQAELGKAIGTSGDVIGRYERDVITPSIDVIIKTADALEVSIDFLVGKTKMVLDKPTVKRLEDISKLPDDNKIFVLNLIDMALRDFKVKKAHAS